MIYLTFEFVGTLEFLIIFGIFAVIAAVVFLLFRGKK